ncbi:P-loop containing nucleoside triphosphate hydrolase protein, partial [Gautieria morchelliformis]
YDWRTRASSRRRPGGLIDPPAQHDAQLVFPRRYKYPLQPLQPGEKWYPEIQNYKERFLELLTAEQETEQALIRTRLAHWPQSKLKRDGYCLTGLSSFWLQSTQFGKPVAAFLLGPGIALPYHRFENGTQVLLSRLDPLKSLTGQGCVVGSSETEIRISFENKLDLAGVPGGESARAELLSSPGSPTSASAGASPPPTASPGVSRAETILQGTFLRDVLLAGFTDVKEAGSGGASTAKPGRTGAKTSTPSSSKSHADPPPAPRLALPIPGIFSPNQLIHSWALRHRRPTPVVVEGDPDMGALNASQRRAVAGMVGERVSVVQGVTPGTGKTKTIIEAVKLLKVHFQVPHPLLICTYTNTAVDTLVAGLATAGLRPLRVGTPAKIAPALHEHTLAAQVAKHPLRETVERAEEAVKRVEADIARLEDKMRGAWIGGEGGKAEELKRRMERMGKALAVRRGRAWALNRAVVKDVVEGADVICTTCITAATAAMGVVDFPVVFLDEASMSTEPASLIPLMKGSRHLALIGDHKQLPPVITSRKAQAGGLGVSLFERLKKENAVPSIMLDLQYRMHPSLARFPSSEFYNYALYDGTVDLHGGVPPALLPPRSSHLAMDGVGPSVIFLDHAGGEEMKDRSRVNRNEARIVCAIIEDLLMHNPNMMGRDVGVIAPYAAQISLLERTLRANSAYRAQLDALLGPLRAMQVGHVEVKTVDGFEGREKDVIIFSTVRNNAAGHIGFLADRRRMNVGLTRAKRGLFVVGSVGTLRREGVGVSGGAGGGARAGGRGRKGERDVWVRYVDWLSENGAVKVLRGETLAKILGK